MLGAHDDFIQLQNIWFTCMLNAAMLTFSAVFLYSKLLLLTYYTSELV